MTVSPLRLETNRSSIGETKFVSELVVALQEGQARLALKRFALTANNVTYAALGEMFSYWDFFPSSNKGFGRVPVWGFGDVVESRADGVEVGTRLYGYYPMSHELVVSPDKVTSRGFVDATPHRQPMAAAYNRYEIVNSSDGDAEGRVALLKPLFITGFLLDDWISSEKAWGATHVISSSASSKTALAMAACFKRRGNFKLTGLTSPRSKEFVEASGYYDQVVTYDEVAALEQFDSV